MLTDNILDLIGNTPLIRLKGENIFAKAEFLNPGGSIKDRIALGMLEGAERDGRLKPDSIIVEPTSGNTGIGLALVGSLKGYRVRIFMPENMSEERKMLIRTLGAELVLTEAAKGMKGAVAVAEELHAKNPGSFVPRQFDNPANPQAHRQGTAREIWNDTGGTVDVLVSGVGTGGTLTGCGGELRKNNPKLRIVAVEPEDSPVISGGDPGPHKIMGIGAGFIPENLKTDLIDEVVKVGNEESMAMARRVASEEGLFVGISSGAALVAALRLASSGAFDGKCVVVILPDFGERYLSTDLFAEFMN